MSQLKSELSKNLEMVIVWHFTAQNYTSLHNIFLQHNITLHHTTPHYTTLHFSWKNKDFEHNRGKPSYSILEIGKM